MTQGRALVVRVVTDGRAGNENPALGLAESLQRRRAEAVSIETLRLSTARPFAAAPAGIWDALSRLSPTAPLTALKRDETRARLGTWLRQGGLDGLVIGAGRRSAPVVAALRARSPELRAIQLLNPQLPLDRFDCVIAPAHDRLQGETTLRTVGSLHRIAPESLAAAEDPRVAAQRRPLLGVLIGGPSKSASMEAAALDALLTHLEALAAEGAGLAVTASRRTPPELQERITARISAVGGFVFDGSGANPYLAILSHADALIVTADSVNMGSEASATGKPVWIARLGRLSPKLERFQAALSEGRHAADLPPAASLDMLRTQERAPLDDMTRAVERTLALLGER